MKLPPGENSGLPFVKMEAVGNDFVLVRDPRRSATTPLPSDPSVQLWPDPSAPSRPEPSAPSWPDPSAPSWPDPSTLSWPDPSAPSWPDLARRLCARRFGVGADGLLVVGPSDRADARMRMFNPDGTEDHCGNGIRCAAAFAVAIGMDNAFATTDEDSEDSTEDPENTTPCPPCLRGEYPEGERRLTLETLAGVRSCRVFRRDGAILVVAEMGEPRFAPEELPMSVTGDRVVDYPLAVAGDVLLVTVVSTGTTHAVVFLPGADVERLFARLSPSIETHPLFPERTSIMWATRDGPDRLRLRIWERGAGETLGCGTGACAAMVAARLHGFVGDRAEIRSRGGVLEVAWTGAGPIRLTGPARFVYRGWWRDGLSG